MATIIRNKYLVYLSIILFFYFSSIGCLIPFLTSHMRHLGFSIPEISFINAVSAFISLLGPVILGTVVEKYRNYKLCTVICIFIGTASFIALSFVPSSQKHHYRPLVDFSCKDGIRIERCPRWDDCDEAFPMQNMTTVKLTNCRYQCSRASYLKPAHPLHVCFHSDSGNICIVYDSITGNMSSIEFDTLLSSWPYDVDEISIHQKSTSNFTIKPQSNSDVFESIGEEEDAPRAEKVSVCNYHARYPVFFNQKQYNSMSCRPTLNDCVIHCRASFSSGGVSFLPNPCEEANGNPTTTFWSYLILRCLGDLCLLTAICLLDAVTICCTTDYEGAYGRVHIWPALGLAALSPFSGALLDHFTDIKGRVDFSPSSFLFGVLAILTCALIIALPINTRKYTSQFQSLSVPMKSNKFFTAETFVFLFIVLILGIQWGIIFTFQPWLTMDIGCSGMMTGLGFTFIFGCSLPFLLISKNMVRNIGRGNLLVFALLFYGTRYAGMSFVFSSWWILPFAAMGAFTLCVMWVAAVAYGQSLAPVGQNVLMQYVLNSVHFGLGRGLGCLLGGTLISHFGQRPTFRGIAVFSACLGFLYLAIYHLTFRRRKKTAWKDSTPALMNGSWYPLREQHPNGTAKTHKTAVIDEVDDLDSTNVTSTE